MDGNTSQDGGGARPQVEDAVRRAERFWFQARVPRSARRRLADELRGRLDREIEEGGDVSDVVGDDPVRLAAAWRRATDDDRWLDTVVSTGLGSLALVGAFAFLGPVTDTGGVGLNWFALWMVGAATLGSLLQGLVVNLRDRLSRWAVVAAGIAAALILFWATAVLAPDLGLDLGAPDLVLALPVGIPTAALVVALVGQAAWWKHRRDAFDHPLPSIA